MKKLAICMPVFGRPQRTVRAIEAILAQTINNWEAFIIGDCCPEFQKLIDNKIHIPWLDRAAQNGNDIILFNTRSNEGGYGYAIRNFVNHFNNAEFIIYLDNDDMLEPDHFENYLAGIEGTGNDFVYFNSYKKFLQRHLEHECGQVQQPRSAYIRDTKVEDGMIGHAEIIVRSAFFQARSSIKENPEYGHDWDLITQMIDHGAVYAKAENPVATYNIMGAGELREKEID